MKSLNNRIEEIKNNGYQLDFGTVFESAFENYKKIALYAGLMLLVFSILFVIVLFAGLILYVGIENLENFGEKLKQYSTLKVIPLEIAIPLNVGSIITTTLLSPFMAGFLKMADCGEKDEEFHISTMFSFYKSPFFFTIFLAVFLITSISTGFTLLLSYTGFNFLGSLISMFISFMTLLTVPFIVFGKLNTIESIRSSITIVSKQPLILLGLLIVTIIVVILGIFGFCIGIFFTLPFMYSMNYVIYKTIIGMDDSSEIVDLKINKN